MRMQLLKERVIIVTGGSGLLGTEICKDIVENGGIPIILDIKAPKEEKYQYIYTDCTDEESISTAIGEILDKYTLIHGAVHSAYPRTEVWGESIETLNYERLSRDLSMQIGSAILVSKVMLRLFKKQRYGSFVHIGSIMGLRAPKFENYEGLSMSSPIEYTAIKGSIVSITKWLAKYSFGYGIRFNCVSPGGIEDGQSDKFMDRYRSSCSNIGMLSGKHISSSVTFLLSERSNAITGQNLIVDDGWSL
jgi:NAD(P)-dependent dehydrogenase (short-subunit alcohol dehydrogenase family)